MKTKETVDLENLLWLHTDQRKDFGCFEVTIGWYGRQRVDFITIDGKDTVRCYEIKVTKSDFHSENGHNFVGTFNYYVMPHALYETLKDEIPAEIGVYTDKFKHDLTCIKKAKRKTCEDVENIKLYMIRSLQREYAKARCGDSIENINYLNRQLSKAQNDYNNERSQCIHMANKYHQFKGTVIEVLGDDAYSKIQKAIREG